MTTSANNDPFKSSALTTILVVSDLSASKSFYTEVLWASLFLEYDGSSVFLEFLGHWIIMVNAGEPSAVMPVISFKPPSVKNSVSHSFTIRVTNCHKSYEILKEKGANFITPPYDWGAEIRCFFSDPDGHLFEISEYKGTE